MRFCNDYLQQAFCCDLVINFTHILKGNFTATGTTTRSNHEDDMGTLKTSVH